MCSSGLNAGSSLDLRALCILSGRTCWVLCIDALVLSMDGSLLDALSIAVRVSSGHRVRLCLLDRLPSPHARSKAVLLQRLC